MQMSEMVRKNRSYRRFDQSKPVTAQTLHELAGLTRYCASATNMQPLRYALVADPAKCAEVFECLAWAGYLTDWPGPAEGERPTGYVVMLCEGKSGPWTRADMGIAAQTILLGAVEKGLGGCMLGALKREPLAEVLGLGDGYEIMLVVALGVPAETVVIDDLEPGGDVKYWRDEASVHHVPKRRTGDVVLLSVPESKAP